MPVTSKLQWFTELRGAQLTDAEFRVLVILATYTDASMSNAFPGLTKLIEASCVSRSAVKRALASLQKKGWIRLASVGGNEVGKGVANVWQIVPKGSASEPLKGFTSGPLAETGRGPTDTPQGVQIEPLKGSTSGPPSGKNYQVKESGRSSYVSNADAGARENSADPETVIGGCQMVCVRELRMTLELRM